MAEITNTQTKTITLRNQISIGGKNTIIQTFTIDSTNGKMTRTEPIFDNELYKANRKEIKEIMNNFEDYVYSVQDEILTELEETIEISE